MFVHPQKRISGLFHKYEESFSVFSQQIIKKENAAFFGFACFILTGTALYQLLGGHLFDMNGRMLMRFVASVIEPLGLLVVQRKIQTQKNVTGVSGMTMAMYAAVYGLRIVVSMPAFTLDDLDLWVEEVVGSVSLLIVLSILRAVFMIYRDSYQRDLDAIHAKYLIPTCLVLAVVLRPQFSFWSPWQGFLYSFCLYMDVVALVPQVVMMARGNGRVAAPIAHFVAATFMCRLVHLWDLHYVDYGREEYMSFLIVAAFHVLHLLLIVDFMYYYLKARFAGSRLVEDLHLGTDIC